uniref:Uncharacterized protein n=1 Tax=viral metagenome TaxID=1070528 RepID=A0A6C0KQS8_9ZZZZ
MASCDIDFTKLIIFCSIAGIISIAIGAFYGANIWYSITIVIVMYTLLLLQFILQR